MGALLENVGPDVVEEVDQRILAAEAGDAEGQVLDGRASRLAVNRVAIHEGVLKEGGDSVDVVLAHLTDVLEHEAQRLEDAVLDVELRDAVLIHERRQDREGSARLGHDRHRHGRAHPHLPILHLEVVEQRVEHVLGPDGLGDVTEGGHSRAADGLLVRLEELEELEADAHPFLGGDEFGPAVGDASHQIDAIFLNLFMPVPQDGSEPREQIPDGRGHLRHPDHVHDGPQRP
mmetsp:Transcript_47908/g.101821  ORF Transcript_47908/g.101821 Transcript_47908/m.101821 type:complete len:232 (-) Transcript_47908:2403-3098(-)